MKTHFISILTALLCCIALTEPAFAQRLDDRFFAPGAIRVLVISGRNNHDWKTTTPFLKKLLQETGRFEVRVNEEPAGITAATLESYDVLVLNYNGPRWGDETEKAVESFVNSGGGMVVVHGASWAFSGLPILYRGDNKTKRTDIIEPVWSEYKKMIGGVWQEEPLKTAHGNRHEFTVKYTNRLHPIAAGASASFKIYDELFHYMDMDADARVLATAYSAKEERGTGRNEPILWTVNYGRGRVFHTALGHDLKAMQASGFVSSFVRGAEWAATGAVAEKSDGEKGKRPNILFIAVDDLRPELGCYGNTRIQSPNIDRLAESGTVFLRAYCQQAICMASRASLLSGFRPDVGNIWNNKALRANLPDVISLPQHFRNHGYRTYSIGKIYHHDDDDRQGWLEHHYVNINEPLRSARAMPMQAWAAGYQRPENYSLIENYQQRLKPNVTIPRPASIEVSDRPDNEFPDGYATDIALQKLKEARGQDEPFFLATGYYRPHLPFVVPQKYWDLYQPEDIVLANNPFRTKGAPDCSFHDWLELRRYGDIPREGPVSDAKARELIRGYYASVSFTDAQVGRLLKGLRDYGFARNTIVILWGDHGWNLGEHGLWCKHTNFETSVRVPMMIHVPGTSGKQSTSALTELVDIYPSLCELAGVPLPDHLQGTSFAPLLDEPDRTWKSAAFSQYPRGELMGYSMRTEQYRFTQWQRKDNDTVEFTELYDHNVDPNENINIANESGNAALVQSLQKQLQNGWQQAVPPQ